MDSKWPRRMLEEPKKRAQRDFKNDMQKNIYFGDANDPQTFKPGLAWKRKAPLVISWNLIHPSSY